MITLPIYDSRRRPAPMIEELRGIWQFRHFLLLLVRRNIKLRYRRSVLGVGWTMLNPLLTMLVLTAVFSLLFRAKVEHYAVYVLSGLVLWQFFSWSSSAAMNQLVWGEGLIGRVYVPRAIFATSAVGSGLVNLLVSLVPLSIIMLLTGAEVRPAMLFLVVPILLTTMFTLGVSLLVSTLAVYFADVLTMYDVVLMIWFYLSAIIYPLSIVPEGLRRIVQANPMYLLIELFRAPVLSGSLPPMDSILGATLSSAVVLLVGWWYFARKADEFPYRI